MMNQIKKAAKWLLPPIVLLPFRPGYCDARDTPAWSWRDVEGIVVRTGPSSIYPAGNAWRPFAGAIKGALAPVYRIVYRFVAQVGDMIILHEQVAHHRGTLLQREPA